MTLRFPIEASGLAQLDARGICRQIEKYALLAGLECKKETRGNWFHRIWVYEISGESTGVLRYRRSLVAALRILGYELQFEAA